MSNESTRADRVIHQAAMIIRGGAVGGATAFHRARELYNAGLLKDSTELIAGVEYCSLCGMELTECCDCIPQVEQDRMLYDVLHGRDEPATIVPPAQERRVVNRMPRLRVSEGRTAFGHLEVGQMVLVEGCYFPAIIQRVIGYGRNAQYEVLFTEKDPKLGTYRASITPANIMVVLP
ncbi:hypothetical protein KHQ84_gp114 [Rhodococcus phage Finch]|uniref:Uncharacterized protein n=1 Tax=Rhodococcus phage Finch TaxID=2094144 RepID=A0A2P1JXI4_9CAUD|nr:hypothetical protein KHQ84_gp114 [Rhodococcus phage Finch]AVO25045.1 hypothetical protein SEA_FINCH_114 [Rhodococcus phage Finch]